MPRIITASEHASLTCVRSGTARKPPSSMDLVSPSVASILVVSATKSSATRTGTLTPPLAPASAICTSSRNLDHSNFPLTITTLNSRARRFGSGSVNNRRATYGNAALRKLKLGSRVKQMFSCVNSARMTSEKRSGTRIGYMNSSLLNSFVKPRKEKLPLDAMALKVSVPHTSARPSATGRTSLPGSRKPKSLRHTASAS
mmetsp:Transcript_8796/g.37170  ORF Transcript_8796/g.37170 Transcript_8796/m.37170 type:complete len:200 (+) Transcript_8796:1282-1881(+)